MVASQCPQGPAQAVATIVGNFYPMREAPSAYLGSIMRYETAVSPTLTTSCHGMPLLKKEDPVVRVTSRVPLASVMRMVPPERA